MKNKICAVLLTVSLGAPVFGQPMDPASLHSQAISSYHEGRYEEAISQYKQLIRLDPDNMSFLRDLMWVLWKGERFEEAEKIAQRVIAIRPDDAEAKNIIEKAPTLALRAKANANFHAGRYEAATDIYRRLAEQDPKNASILRDLMWSLWETRQYGEAQSTASRILEIHKDDAEAKDILKRAPLAAMRAKAIQNYQSGHFDEAAAIYKDMAERSPKNPGLLKDLYWAQWQKGRYDKATETALQLTENFPDEPEGWNMLGRVYVITQQPENALEAYQQSLNINPKQPDTRRLVGRLMVDLREFDQAIGILSDLEKKDSVAPTIYPQLAKAQFFKGLYADSARNWAKAVELFPQNDNYKIHEARALYYGGQIPLALEKFKTIAAGSGPMKGLALDFIVDDAMSTRDYVRAEKMLEENLREIRLQDEPRLLKLANVYLENHKLKECLRTLDRYIKICPSNIPALLMKADVLYAAGRNREAVKIYKMVKTLNPYSISASDGLANAQLGRGNTRAALKAFETALQLDPTDPYLIISKAHYLDSSGRQKQSRELLEGWLKANSGLTVPVLLYHGLTPFKRDPLLAYPVHVTTAAFEDHMRALKAAGYTPVTTDQLVAWYKKNAALPKKPILITFDDGRLDSFRYGDPILKKYNLKATMFIPIANVEGNLPPSYVSWPQVAQYRDSGRWDFQSHGDMGHMRIQIDEFGRQGLFLVNRQWLEKDHRLETVKEWKRRVIDDHASVKKKIAERLGKAPLTYAYPEGTYGQIDIVNSPQAVPVNLEASRKEFEACFHQDRFGLNVRSRDPMYLTRLEPHPDWSGDDLVKYLQDNSPYVYMYRRLLWQAVWDSRPRKGKLYLNKLNAAGASQVVLLGEEGRIRSSVGDFGNGWKSVEKAMSLGKDRDTEKLRDTLRIERRPLWTPGYTYAEDNRHRKSSIFEQTLRFFPASPFTWGIDYRNGHFKERGFPDVKENGAGLNVIGKLSDSQKLSARAMWHWLDGSVSSPAMKDTYTAAAALDSNWTDSFETELHGGRALYDNVRSLNAGVTEDFGTVRALWRQDGPWRLGAKVEGADISDGNRRYGTQVDLSRFLFSNFRGVYKYTFDHMDQAIPNYYSPQQLHQHQLGLEYASKIGWLQPTVTYLPGVGKERGTKTEFIEDLEAGVLLRFNQRASLYPYYGLIKTPTYRRNTYNVVLTVHF